MTAASWRIVERIARVFAFPLVVLVATAIVNFGVGKNTDRQKTLELAVSVLRDPKSDDEKQNGPSPLRPWAAAVLNKVSEVKLSNRALQQLGAGETTFPSAQEGYPNVTGYCETVPNRAKIGEKITFTAFGQGGSNVYAYSWLGDDEVSCQTRTFTAIYHTPGCKQATVRITSNGQSCYRTCAVEVVSVNSIPSTTKADIVDQH